MLGVHQAIRGLHSPELPASPSWEDFDLRLGASSAAGGLRMVVCGLTENLTAKAGLEAAQGAGARVYGVFSGILSSDDVNAMAQKCPDIILFTGGTDGGEVKRVKNNAQVLTQYPGPRPPVVVACNQNAAPEIVALFSSHGFEVYRAQNVMPALEQLAGDSAREAIRGVFMRHITKAKGLEHLTERLNHPVVPTPYAVMKGLSCWHPDSVAVDVGGATTDVYSFADGRPTVTGLIPRGIRQPKLRRTVEGDLGIRESVSALKAAAGSQFSSVLFSEETFSSWSRDEVEQRLRAYEAKTVILPGDDLDRWLDEKLSRLCIDLATRRHAGTLVTRDTPQGPVHFLYGKDLRDASRLIGTGGTFFAASRGAFAKNILKGALFTNDGSLRPKSPDLWVDPDYRLFAAGLLSLILPEEAGGLLEGLEPL